VSQRVPLARAPHLRALHVARDRRGLTLIEVLMGSIVVGLVLVSASWALSQASTNRHIHEESPINAALFAREIHELALTLPTAASGGGTATSGIEAIALDTLDGATFSPPIDSFKFELPAAGWSQHVTVGVYSLDDLETPVSEGFTTASKSSPAIYRLSVQVLQGDVDRGTWWWWINP
jgi:prepilin-type N-terminal cleavage/methylation domain-containing protein